LALGHGAMFQSEVGAGGTGDPRRHARQTGAAGGQACLRQAGPLGPGSPKGFGSYRWIADGLRLRPRPGQDLRAFARSRGDPGREPRA